MNNQQLFNWLSNNWISLFSLLVAFYSVYYTYKIDKRNKPHLEIELDSRSHSILRPCDSYGGVSAQAFFQVSIINKSNSPISIYKITDGENVLAHKCAPHKNNEYRRETRSKGIISARTVNLSNQLILPLRLDSYDALEKVIFFPSFTKLSSGETIELCFFTSRGIFKKTIDIKYSDFTKDDIIRTGRR